MNHTLEFIRGICIVVSFGILGGLILVRWFQRSEDDPKVLIIKIAVTIPLGLLAFFSVGWFGVFGPFVIVFCGVVFSIIWTPNIAAWAFRPLTSLFDGGSEPPDPKPLYSVSRALAARGRFLEAVTEVQRQLAKFPNDFEGQMLLAEIQAKHLHDLPSAETTLQKLCDQKGKPSQEISAALTTLADWQLKLARNHVAAKNCLEQIVGLFPDTEFSAAATQRIAHLGDGEMLRLPHERPKYAVPEGIKNYGLRSEAGLIQAHEASPQELAAKFIKQLEAHPHDSEARENLAEIYANHYRRMDLAADQLEQLIALPNQPAKLVVRWLNMLADLQVRCAMDHDAAKNALQRIATQFPNTAAAEVALNRIERLRLEVKGKEQQSQAVKLGVYEQNIGLKMGLPR